MSQPRQDALRIEENTSSGDIVLFTTPVGILLVLENRCMFGAVNGSQEGGRKLEVAVDVGLKREKR